MERRESRHCRARAGGPRDLHRFALMLGDLREALRMFLRAVSIGLVLGGVIGGVTCYFVSGQRLAATLSATEAQLVACPADRGAEHETGGGGLIEGAGGGGG